MFSTRHYLHYLHIYIIYNKEYYKKAYIEGPNHKLKLNYFFNIFS